MGTVSIIMGMIPIIIETIAMMYGNYYHNVLGTITISYGNRSDNEYGNSYYN